MRLTIGVLTIILLVMLVFYCWAKPEIDIQTYGIITENNKNKIVLINPEKFDSFDQLTKRIEQIVCNDSIPTISVKDKNVEKRIGLANYCWENVVSILIKNRNVLKIQDEKIEINKTVELDSLDEYILKHYSNNGNSNIFSENPRKAKVSITYKYLPIKGPRTLINKIVESYEAQNLEPPLIITLDRIIPPPPSQNDENESSK